MEFEGPLKQLDVSCFGGYIQLLGGHFQDEHVESSGWRYESGSHQRMVILEI